MLRSSDPSRPTGHRRSTDLGRPTRRFSRAHRQLVAALLAGVAALVALSLLRPSPPATTTILVASRTLPAGHTITDADVTAAAWPTSVGAPPATAQLDELRGRVTAGPMTPGEPLSLGRIVGPNLLELSGTTDPGNAELVAAPVRLADAGQAALIRPGDLVDVIAARASDGGGQSAERVAIDARVITIAATSENESGLLSSGSSDPSSTEPGSLIVLAVSPATATELAAATTRSRLSVVLKPTASAHAGAEAVGTR